MNPQMKAGPELDARLCELLEPLASLRYLDRPIAPLGEVVQGPIAAYG